MRIKSFRRPQYVKTEIEKKTKDLNPPEKVKHLKIKNEKFLKLSRSLT